MRSPTSKREQILVAACEIFGTKGFHSANISDIAEAAGIGKGTVYEYFKSKNDLFFEAIRYNAENYVYQMKLSIIDHDQFYDQLNAFIQRHQMLVKENFEKSSLLLQNPSEFIASMDTGENIFEFLMGIRSEIVLTLTKILELGQRENHLIDDDYLFIADMLFEQIHRLAIRANMMKISQSDIKIEQEKLLALFMKGVQKCSQTTV